MMNGLCIRRSNNVLKVVIASILENTFRVTDKAEVAMSFGRNKITVEKRKKDRLRFAS